MQTGYTCESGVLKSLSLSHYKHFENSYDPKVKLLVLTDNLKVYHAAFRKDRAELRLSIQFDEREKVNIGLFKTKWD